MIKFLISLTLVTFNVIFVRGQDTSSGCIKEFSKEYTYSFSRVINSVARTRCDDLNSTLVQIRSSEENEFVIDFSQTLNPSRSIWIGVERLSDIDITNPLTLTYLDGSPITTDFAGVNGVSPWRTNEPNDAQSDCIELLFLRAVIFGMN